MAAKEPFGAIFKSRENTPRRREPTPPPPTVQLPMPPEVRRYSAPSPSEDPGGRGNTAPEDLREQPPEEAKSEAASSQNYFGLGFLDMSNLTSNLPSASNLGTGGYLPSASNFGTGGYLPSASNFGVGSLYSSDETEDARKEQEVLTSAEDVAEPKARATPDQTNLQARATPDQTTAGGQGPLPAKVYTEASDAAPAAAPTAAVADPDAVTVAAKAREEVDALASTVADDVKAVFNEIAAEIPGEAIEGEPSSRQPYPSSAASPALATAPLQVPKAPRPPDKFEQWISDSLGALSPRARMTPGI